MGNREARELEEQRRKLVFDVAVDTRKFEISLFWQRSLFFWGFISAAFVGYAALGDDKDTEVAFIIGCFGFVCSVAWTLVNRGSKYWQEVWEHNIDRVEKEVLGTSLFRPDEEIHKKVELRERRVKEIWGPRRYSVSMLVILLSDFAAVIWAALVIKASRRDAGRDRCVGCEPRLGDHHAMPHPTADRRKLGHYPLLRKVDVLP